MVKNEKVKPDVGQELESKLPKLWQYYNVVLEVKNRIYGGLPKDPELIEGFLKGKGMNTLDIQERMGKIVKEIDTAVPENAPEGENLEKSWTCFKVDETGIYIETRQIKAMLKECTSASELWKKVHGLKSRIGDQVFPIGQGGDDLTRIYLTRDGQALKAPDGYEQSPARVKGPQGERSIIKIKDYVDKPGLTFKLKVGGNTITLAILQYLFEYGEEIGIGADRSQERGKYKIVKLEKE